MRAIWIENSLTGISLPGPHLEISLTVWTRRGGLMRLEGGSFVDFEESYANLVRHRNAATGSKYSRLVDGDDQHAETLFLKNVWWPAFRNFDNLYPEYEIRDFNDGRRYLDFAYIQAHFRVAIEIDGIGPHWKDISQEQFSDHCHRQNHLIIDGWHVLRFTYQDVLKRPKMCQRTVQQLMGRLTTNSSDLGLSRLALVDREIVRLVLSHGYPIKVTDVAVHAKLSRNGAIQHLKHLVEEEWLVPASGSIRVRSYGIHPSKSNLQL